MKFEIYYRKTRDGRAPEHVCLAKEYSKGGTLTSINRRQLQIKVIQMIRENHRDANSLREISIGDVLIEHGPVRQNLIYTFTGAWALVKLVSES